MILVKSPLRLSFFGGGSDIPEHFEKYGGATLSACFDKYVYAGIMYTPQQHIKVAYSDTQYVSNVDEIRHNIIREALHYFNIKNNIEITSFADIPTVGTGLGASSSFCVALSVGLAAYHNNKSLQESELFDIATTIELDMVGSPIGWQDQIAAVVGGVHYTTYSKDLTITTQIPCRTADLDNCLFLVKTPTRQISANEILSTPMPPDEVNKLAEMATYAYKENVLNNIPEFGKLLNDAWQLKKTLHPNITTPDIDAMYSAGINAGILGGKLLGAGNGGFLLMCAKSIEEKKAIQKTVYHDFQCYNIKIVKDGAKVVYDDR